jgi:6-phosphogluconolactonase (cycloisomerase 2 family)
MVVGSLLLSSTVLHGQQPNFVYTNNNTDPFFGTNTVSAFSVGPNGALTPIGGSPFSTGGMGFNGNGIEYFAPNRIIVSPSANFLFVANDGSSDVSVFVIDPNTGTLTLIPGSPFATGGNGTGGMALSATPNGEFLIVGHVLSGNITVFSVAPNGALAPIPSSPFAKPVLTMKVSPNGLYLADFAFDSVAMFKIGTDGSLNEIPGSPFLTPGSGGGGIDINCSSTFLYALNSTDSTWSVVAFSISSSGGLTPISGSPFSPGVGTGALVPLLSPSDNYLFVTNSSSVTVFSVSSDGSLAVVQGSPFPVQSGAIPVGMATNQLGTFLYVASFISPYSSSVEAFSVADNGSLAPVPGSPFPISQIELFSLAAFPPKSCQSSSAFLNFPLAGKTPNTAEISTVMDHHIAMSTGKKPIPLYYSADNAVYAFTGDEGTANCSANQASCFDYNKNKTKFTPYGYKNAAGTSFAADIPNYTGGSGCYDSSGNSVSCDLYLFYEGHPGFDYPASLGTDIYAPANGIAFIPDCDPVQRKNDCTKAPEVAVDGFNILTVDHGNGYSTWYLHMGDLEEALKEPWKVPGAPYQVTVSRASQYQGNVSVTYASTKKLLKEVVANPGSGQYSVDVTSGIYTFSSSDSGVGVLISYFYATDFRVVTCPGEPPITLHKGDGQRIPVTPQCSIGQTGNKAINLSNKPLKLGPHLHFEVRKGLVKNPNGSYTCLLPACFPVDPYGWTGPPGHDPYPLGFNVTLWK